MNANTYSSPAATGGNADYVAGTLTILEPEGRPYTAGIANITSSASATYSEKGLNAYQPVNVTGSPEGSAANTGGNKAAKRARYGVYPHRTLNPWSVTDVQQIIAKKGGNHFTQDEEAFARAQCLAECGRNIEASCLTAAADVAPSPSGNMTGRGVFNWLGGSAANVPTGFQTPANQRLSSITTLVENGSNSLRTVLDSLLTSTGKAGMYDMLLGATYLNHFDLFSAGVSTDYAFRFQNNGRPEELKRVVKLYTCSAGSVTAQYSAFLDITATTTTGNASAALLLGRDMWEIDFLFPLGESEYNEDSGGCNGAYKAIFFNHCLHPKGSAYLVSSFNS
mgnify:CR=1 FL=1